MGYNVSLTSLQHPAINFCKQETCNLHSYFLHVFSAQIHATTSLLTCKTCRELHKAQTGPRGKAMASSVVIASQRSERESKILRAFSKRCCSFMRDHAAARRQALQVCAHCPVTSATGCRFSLQSCSDAPLGAQSSLHCHLSVVPSTCASPCVRSVQVAGCVAVLVQVHSCDSATSEPPVVHGHPGLGR